MNQFNFSEILKEPETGEGYEMTHCPCCENSKAFDAFYGDVVCNECNRIFYVREYNAYLDKHATRHEQYDDVAI